MAAPLGAVVRIFYDSLDEVNVGDGIQTTTGRTYVVLERRRQLRGKRAGRCHLLCVVVAEKPEGAPTHRLFWYRRTARAP